MSKQQLQIAAISLGAALMYLLMAFMIDYVIASDLLKQIVPQSHSYGLASFIVTWIFGVPAFILGFVFFVSIDWGLKRIWYKRSAFGLIPVIIPLLVPFSLIGLELSQNIIIPIASSAAAFLWSVLVVSLQLVLENVLELNKKPRREDSF